MATPEQKHENAKLANAAREAGLHNYQSTMDCKKQHLKDGFLTRYASTGSCKLCDTLRNMVWEANHPDKAAKYRASQNYKTVRTAWKRIDLLEKLLEPLLTEKYGADWRANNL